MMPDRIFIDIRTCNYTLGRMMREVERLIADYPEYEIFMDGDAFAIVGRLRV